jgi:hypothetical protein
VALSLGNYLKEDNASLRYWFVMRLAGSGPLWKAALEADYEMCRTGVWTNLL